MAGGATTTAMPKLYVTRQVMNLLGVSECRVADLVRRGKIVPPPTVLSARRLWTPDQIRQAARALGLLVDVLGALDEQIGAHISVPTSANEART